MEHRKWQLTDEEYEKIRIQHRILGGNLTKMIRDAQIAKRRAFINSQIK